MPALSGVHEVPLVNLLICMEQVIYITNRLNSCCTRKPIRKGSHDLSSSVNLKHYHPYSIKTNPCVKPKAQRTKGIVAININRIK